MFQDAAFERFEIGHPVVFPECLPGERQREKAVTHKNSAARDEVQGRMQLEKEDIALGERFEIRLTSRPPKIHLVGLPLREKSEPLVIGDSDKEFHATSATV